MTRRRIDVHQHLIPPAYRQWLEANGIREAGGREIPEWSPAHALETMDAHDIATGIVSISTPGVRLPGAAEDDADARGRARDLNELSARLAHDHPGRFGFFATLPLPDMDGALAEVAYAFDTLNASGVVLLANVLGCYLGAPEHEPLFAELDRRKAVVFVHPAELPSGRVDGIPPFAADFLLDTTRAAFRMVQNGILQRYRSLKIILSHAGGFVPYASHRLAVALSAVTQRAPFELLDELASFYFDTALSGSPAALPSLLAFAKPGHVLFGSDWPYAPDIAVGYFTGQLDGYPGLDSEGHAAIARNNAELLFPQFAATASKGRA